MKQREQFEEMVAETNVGRIGPECALPAAALPEFSLVLGGPLYQLLRRARLSGDYLQLLRRRVLVIAGVAWLPLLVLCLADGTSWRGVPVPFLMDVEVHARFLVALPLLVAAELVVHDRLRPVAGSFLARGLILPSDMPRLEQAIERTCRWRNSITAEIVLVGLVYVFGVSIVWREYITLPTATWYATPADGGSRLTPAGVWLGYVSLPIFQFLLCRWYFRLVLWTTLLWRISRLDLQLVPTHPDRAAGLGFLSATVYAFIPLLLAHGVLLSGVLANQIFHAGARLTEFRLEILLLVIFLMVLVVGPLTVFGAKLAAAKRQGLRDYGAFAQSYVRAFDDKWLRRQESDETLLGTGDLQSLADLGNSFAVVREMRLVPVSKEAILQLAIVALVPLVPLLLTLMPLDELLQKLIGVVF